MIEQDVQSWDIDTAVAHLRASDPIMAGIIDQAGPITAGLPAEPYPALVRAILYQQLAGPAAAAIERRFLALYGDGRAPTAHELLETPEEALRGAGVSRQKIGYLRDLAERARAGEIADELHALPDDEVVARVIAVKGVGRWTADMLLIGCLRRPDVLPVGDLGTRKGIQRAYNLSGLPKPPEMERIAEPWRPYRSIATRYLWRWLDTVTP